MKKSQLRQIIKEEIKSSLNESLEFTPEERKQLIYILGIQLDRMEDQGDEFFAEEIEIIKSILNKIK